MRTGIELRQQCQRWLDGGDGAKVDSMGLHRISDKGHKGKERFKDNSELKLE